MEATDQNFRIADKILTLLAEENCTVRQAEEILAYTARCIREESTVQLRRGGSIKRRDSVD